MEEKNEFSDLILDDQNNGSKAKKLLLNVIVIVIVILIAMVGYKIFNSDTANQDDLDEQNLNTNFIVPKDSNDDENAIPIVNESFDDFKNNQLSDMENIGVSEEAMYYPKAPEVIKESAVGPKQTIPVPKTEPEKEVVVAIKPEPKPEPKPVPKANPKKDIFDTVQTQKPAIKPSKPVQVKKDSNLASKGSYVQILAGKKLDLSSREVKNIKDKGFDFVVYKDPKTGIEKLLVGPHSGESLKAKLDEVRKKVKKDAFIFHVK